MVPTTVARRWIMNDFSHQHLCQGPPAEMLRLWRPEQADAAVYGRECQFLAAAADGAIEIASWYGARNGNGKLRRDIAVDRGSAQIGVHVAGRPSVMRRCERNRRRALASRGRDGHNVSHKSPAQIDRGPVKAGSRETSAL